MLGGQVAVRQLRLGVPAPRGQLVGEHEQVERRVVGGEADDGGLGRGEQPQPVDGLGPRAASPRDRVAGRRGQPQVAVVAEVAQGGEGRRDRAAGAGRRDHRVDHRVAGPVGVARSTAARRSAASRCSSTETPFGAYAYLCRSTEIDW